MVACENLKATPSDGACRVTSCESRDSTSSVADSQRKLISTLAENMPDSKRFLERARIAIEMDEWQDIVEKVRAALPSSDDDDDDDDDEEGGGDDDDKDDTSKQTSTLPPIPSSIKAQATAPLIDERTNLSLEIILVKDQHNRLIGATLFDETAKKGQCPFTIVPNQTGQVRVYAVYKNPNGKGGDRMYFTPPMAIPGIPKVEDDSDGDDNWVPCA